MKKIPKINTIHFALPWISICLLIGVALPLLVWFVSGKYYKLFDIIAGILLLLFIIVFAIEMYQDFGKRPYYLSKLAEDVPFDRENQTPVIKCSICNGEQVAGFKNKKDGRFIEVMVIKSQKDIDCFKEIYRIDEITKEY